MIIPEARSRFRTRNRIPSVCTDQLRSALLHFPNQRQVISWRQLLQEFVVVVRFSFGLLISVSLVLTAYFGVAAWRLTGDSQNDGQGSGSPFQLVRPQQP